MYVQRARQKITDICKRWKSPRYRAEKALAAADFYIGMHAWATDEDKPGLRAAIEIFRQFIDQC